MEWKREPRRWAVVWIGPYSPSDRFFLGKARPSSRYSAGASILTSEKSKFRLAKASVVSCVAEASEAFIFPIVFISMPENAWRRGYDISRVIDLMYEPVGGGGGGGGGTARTRGIEDYSMATSWDQALRLGI